MKLYNCGKETHTNIFIEVNSHTPAYANQPLQLNLPKRKLITSTNSFYKQLVTNASL